MKLILALGNPDQKYHFTRHNFAFLALDFYAKTHSLTWKSSQKFLAHTAEQGTIIFAKPTTYYNEIGKSISKLVNFYKLNPTTDLLVVCDDFNLPFGQIRQRNQGSAGGNHGLESIITHLNTTFPRLRLGTDNPLLRKTLGDATFVLSRFTPEEHAQLPAILSEISTKIDQFLTPSAPPPHITQ